MDEASFNKQLAEEIAKYHNDPLGFVMFCYPWGVKGTVLEAWPEGPDTWQRQFLDALGKQLRANPFDGVTPTPPVLMSTTSGHGIGKGKDLSSEAYRVIITHSNGKEEVIMEPCVWGDLKVGDYVYGADGNPTQIIATQHYRRPHYKITFDDRTSISVSGEHEWNVKGRQERRNNIDEWRTIETQELFRLGAKRKNGASMARQWEIPIQKPVQMTHREVFNPYTIGVWLGDGSSTSASITSSREEIWRRIGHTPNKDTLSYKQNGTMNANPPGLHAALTEHKMLGMSDTKFIPDRYKYNSIQVRRDLVSGMLDTDGEVHKSGSIGYSSTSKRLVEDLIWMVRSLGGKATLQSAVKQPRYTKADGTKSDVCKPCYRCTINFADGWQPFTHTYKKALYDTAPSQARYTKRWIDSIELEGDKDGMCIEVDAPDHLYLANDFIVTHNSALTSWLIHFIMSTRPHCKGVITANTYIQLSKKSWSELAKWKKLAINGHWFEYHNSAGNLSYYHPEHKESWAVTGQSCARENSESFAGLHCSHSTPFFIMDEASAIPPEIFEVAQGGLTDGQSMMFLFGNPTRSTGFFADTFGKLRHRWVNYHVDSRTARMTNKTLINEWIQDYGEDSDFVRVRVKGQFPRVGDSQFISNEAVEMAMQREVEPNDADPIVIGVDVARFGDDSSVIVVRHGRKLLTIKKYRELDLMTFTNKVIEAINDFAPHTVFVDGAGLGAGVIDRLRQLSYRCIEVQAGSRPLDPEKFTNLRAEMWWKMRDWLETADIPEDAQELMYELTGIEYGYDERMRVKLEKKSDMKKRGLPSPDEADSLAISFAENVSVTARPRGTRRKRDINWRTL